jgi:hypothetical protein
LAFWPPYNERFYGAILSADFPRWYKNWSWRYSQRGEQIETVHEWEGKEVFLRAHLGRFEVGIWGLFQRHVEDEDLYKVIRAKQM